MLAESSQQGTRPNATQSAPVARQAVGADSDPSWDMVVIGAGPAGSICACSALASSPHMRVALVDRDTFPRDKTCGDAIRNDAVFILHELGMGALFEGRPLIRNISITSPPKFKYIQMVVEKNSQKFESDTVEAWYIVERQIFDDHLCKTAIRRGAGDYTGHQLTAAEFDESSEMWNLTLKGQSGATSYLRCRILVGADGAGSRVRGIAGVRLEKEGHMALGLRAYAQAEGLTDGVLRFDYIASLIPGYGWVFPLTGGKVNIGVALDKRDFKRVGRRLEDYLDEYVRFLGDEGVSIEDVRDIRTHPLPLASQEVPLIPGQRLALVGDAAAMINPWNGEGIHYGIWAGHTLGCAVAQCVDQGGSLQAALEAYATAYRERFGESMKQYKAMHDWVRAHNLLF